MLLEGLASYTSAGKQTDLILLDFSKAFDKVNHSSAISTSNALAFLGNWSQTAVIDGEESESVSLTSRAPQG